MGILGKKKTTSLTPVSRETDIKSISVHCFCWGFILAWLLALSMIYVYRFPDELEQVRVAKQICVLPL